MTTGVDRDLAAMMAGVFAEYRQTHPYAPIAVRDDELWRRLDELGLVRLTGAEEAGGSGAGWHEATELVTAAARHAVRVPLAEHDLLACWLLEAIGEPVGAATRTVGELDAESVARSVPWAAGADRVTLVWRTGGDFRVADVEAAALRITAGHNMIGEPRDTVAADLGAVEGVPVAPDLVMQLRLKGALIRSIQVCAALDRILELSIEHATARVQFGRPLSRFQAVQHQIADLAAEAALARAATEAALTVAVNTEWSDASLDFRVAAARSCAGHATSVVVRNAHQIHGAIGTTREHQLHEYTRAALAWRSEYGSVRYWDEQLTQAALHAGGAGLWDLIAR